MPRHVRRCVPVRRSEEHTSELQSRFDLVCRLLLEKKKKTASRMLDDQIQQDALREWACDYAMAAHGLLTERYTSLPKFFFFNDTATNKIYTLSLHDALPI